MPVALKYPLRWCCERCGWKADNLFYSDMIPLCWECPKCGAKPVLKQEKGLAAVLGKLFR